MEVHNGQEGDGGLEIPALDEDASQYSMVVKDSLKVAVVSEGVVFVNGLH